MEKERPLCLACADIDHLVFLPAGDAALSRRSRKHSTLSAVVVRFSRARKRYERQGAQERAGLARERADAEYVRTFAEQIRACYPNCPAPEADAVAQHACQKYSGRVGRSAAARHLDPGAITLAVTAHVRHRHSQYDKLLAQGRDRIDARQAVARVVEGVLESWMA